ncbi:aspartyl protease family protein At5g10770-like [Vigna unguiculata]|uniref:aspartyl protease family protein At5g10770-like n=1 Tax=Vigna unguiculata TaxID=3917 RepID=UPI0010171637|nr:aspartyl protease family protein At5g10770-like [Vigna unguiculata]
MLQKLPSEVYKMAIFWFLVFSAHLATASSSVVEVQDKDPRQKKEGMQLKLYHVKGLESSQTSTSPFSFSDMIKKDEERVRSLHSALANKDGVRNSASSDKFKGPNLLTTPLKSGLSIGSGNYYVKIGLGTPAKYFSMIVDTGSSLSWLQCQPCLIYCHEQVDPVFTPSTSKTYKRFPCSSPQCSSLKASTLNPPSCSNATGACVYKASYGDSSFSIGYLSQDLLTLSPSEGSSGFVYGCGQDNQGLFGRAAGIIGLANDKLSMLSQLSQKYGNAFSYCLPTSFSQPNSSLSGFLSIGASSLTSSPYKFTPLLKNPKIPSLYFLGLTTITVAGKPIQVSASSYNVPTIIDSGTVITRLPEAVYNALQQSFVTIMSKKYAQAPGYSILDTCFKGSVKEMSTVPLIQLIFRGGAGLALEAHNSLIEIEKGLTCLALAGTPNPISIIGNYQQQTFKVAYDVANSKIGFAAAGCK